MHKRAQNIPRTVTAIPLPKVDEHGDDLAESLDVDPGVGGADLLFGEMEPDDRRRQKSHAQSHSQSHPGEKVADQGSGEHLLREVLENLPQGVAAFDAENRLFAWNQLYQAIFDLPDHLMVAGTRWRDLVSFLAYRGDYGAGDPEVLIEARRSMISRDNELRSELRLNDGQFYESLVRNLPDGGRVVTVHDVTEQKQAEAEITAQRDALEQSNLTKAKLFSIIAHDLRSPFNTVLGFAQLIADHAERATRQELSEYAQEINRSGSRLLQLVDNLLRWSRSQMGDSKFTMSHTKIGPVIERVAALQREVAGDKNITINTELSDDIVAMDQDMIEAVLRNLISNAIKFTQPGGTVEVRTTQQDGNQIEISVADTGVGIEKEQLEHLFEFTAARSKSGTGLGLQICNEFAAAHGSKIMVESKPGEGSTFRFSVPIAE